MATTLPNVGAPRVQIGLREHSPLALWHLLSLDAPTVAVVWTAFIAVTSHTAIPSSSLVAMFLAVWALYASDRLLDGRNLHANRAAIGLELRHHFHHRYRGAFLTGIVFACAVLGVLLRRLRPEALHLYLIEGFVLIAYFLLIHATRTAHRLPKELAVGLFFAAAVFIPTVSRSALLRPRLVGAAILLAALCSLNCLFIYAWEHDPAMHGGAMPRAHATTLLALDHLAALAALIAAGSALFAAVSLSSWPIGASISLSAILLLVLHHNRGRFEPATLRANADLALLTPLALLPFLH